MCAGCATVCVHVCAGCVHGMSLTLGCGTALALCRAIHLWPLGLLPTCLLCPLPSSRLFTVPLGRTRMSTVLHWPPSRGQLHLETCSVPVSLGAAQMDTPGAWLVLTALAGCWVALSWEQPQCHISKPGPHGRVTGISGDGGPGTSHACALLSH